MTKRVMVVDDNREFLDLLTLMLQHAGYAVERAEGGLQALELLEAAEELPDAVVLDIMMPVRSGLELLENLRWDARYERLPVVVLTAMTLNQEEREFIDTFSVACLDKTRTPELISHLNRILPAG